jgi:hypothetical protein
MSNKMSVDTHIDQVFKSVELDETTGLKGAAL